MEPKFIELPEMKFAGLGTKFISVLSPQKNNMQVIPKLWDQFMERLKLLNNRVGDVSYGLVEMLPEDSEKANRDELYYIACAQVSDFNALPPGMTHRAVAAGKYASFTHKGRLDSLEKTMREIYREWLPNAKIQLRESPHIEVYDHRFDPCSNSSEFDVLLPIQ